MHPEFEAVIGLEVHAQLATRTKIFCSCKAKLEDGTSVSEVAVNSNTCPICSAQPGTLPVLNKRAVEYAIRAGLATQCKINLRSVFSRKNYFYPDLPKGYQISQYDLPICEHGYLDINVEGEQKRIEIQRIHMEEDAGKNVHMEGFSLVNLNRAGVPLIEIVSGPDMSSSAEAGAYLRSLHSVVTFLGICDGNMQEGNFRCDANVSVRRKGDPKLGTRAEVKNVNSFRFVEKAIDYEIARQIDVIQNGGKIVQETRTYDADRGMTLSMRSKEEAHDYRYFPEPDLIPLVISEDWISEIRSQLPELPTQKRERFVKEFGLSDYDAGVITASKSLAEFFDHTMELLTQGKAKMDASKAAKTTANYLAGEVSRLMNEENVEITESKLKPEHLARVVELAQDATVSSTGAKQIIGSAWLSGGDVDAIVEKEGLKQVSDLSALEPVIDQVIASNPKQVEQYRAGKDKLIGYFVGQVMKASGGKANPALLQDLIQKKLSS